MPGIRELFGVSPDVRVDGTEPQTDFDVDQFLQEADRAIAANTASHEAEMNRLDGALTPPGEAPAEPPTATVIPEPTVVPPLDTTPPVEPPESLPPEPSLPVDPLLAIPAERRAALLALDQAMAADPSIAQRIYQTVAAPTPEPEVAPTPQLPEDIDPQSFEARLWHEQQETRAQIAQIGSTIRQQQEAFETQRANAAAVTAGNAFAARYADQLSQEDVLAIAQFAGQSGVAATFAQSAPSLETAYDQALEHVLWTNPNFRQKVIPTAPAVQPGETADAVERKRKLTALSSAAQPVSGPPPQRQALQSRPDGRLTPDSRNQLVQELATGIARRSMDN